MSGNLSSQVRFPACQFYPSKFDVTRYPHFHEVLKTSAEILGNMTRSRRSGDQTIEFSQPRFHLNGNLLVNRRVLNRLFLLKVPTGSSLRLFRWKDERCPIHSFILKKSGGIAIYVKSKIVNNIEFIKSEHEDTLWLKDKKKNLI